MRCEMRQTLGLTLALAFTITLVGGCSSTPDSTARAEPTGPAAPPNHAFVDNGSLAAGDSVGMAVFHEQRPVRLAGTRHRWVEDWLVRVIEQMDPAEQRALLEQTEGDLKQSMATGARGYRGASNWRP